MSGIEKIGTDALKKLLAKWPKPQRVHPVRDAFVHEPVRMFIKTPDGSQVSIRKSDIKDELRKRGEKIE